MRFFLLTIVTLGLYPVVRVALGLCRLFGVIGRTSSKTPPRSAPEVEQPPTAETDENIWGKRNALTSACPYCGEIQDPPPKRKKKCRACGKPIRPVMRGGRRMLLTEDAYARLMRQEAKARALRQSHSKAIRADLRRMQTTGITQVQVLTAQDERVCAHASTHIRMSSTTEVYAATLTSGARVSSVIVPSAPR